MMAVIARSASVIKVVRVITRLNIGGPAIHAVLLSRRLDPAQFSTCLVVGEPAATEGDFSELLEGTSARVVRLKSLVRSIHPWADLCSLVRLLGILARERPHILHTHMAKAGALGRLAGMLHNGIGRGRHPGQRAVLIHTFHGHVLDGYFSPGLAALFLWIERWLARRTDVLIAVSRTIRDQLVKKGIGRPEQWRVIPLGLELSRLGQLPLANGSDRLRIGLIGRLVPIKNAGLFLQALARMSRRPSMAAILGVVVGDGPLRPTLECEATRLGVNHLVRFSGWQRDLRPVYEGLDVVCSTSWNEGTPVSLIEAMAAGRAVVATDVGGVRDLLSDGNESSPPPPGGFHLARRGILVQAGDADGLTAALGLLHQDVLLRRQLGEAARAYVLQAFHHERLLRDVSVLYEACVDVL